MTTINESFDKVDSDVLGPDLVWTELSGDIDIVSNQARIVAENATSLARADSALASVNHYAKAVVDATGASGDPSPGVIVRKENNATLTYYEANVNFRTGAIRIGKFVAGAFTSLDSGTASVTPGTPITIELRVDGDALSFLINDVEELSAIDSAIPGGTFTGIRGFRSTTPSSQPQWNSFEAGDIVAAGSGGSRRKTIFLPNGQIYTR